MAVRIRRILLLATIVALLAALGPAAARTGESGPAPQHKGLQRLAESDLATAPDGSVIGIATFEAPPTAAQLDALRQTGLRAQGFRHLPLAAVAGTEAQLVEAVNDGLARDVYPNEALQWMSEESTRAMRADLTRAAGVTGQGVGVAIVDSGVDATHPVLADHVTHNVKILGPEYLSLTGIPADAHMPPGTIVVPVDQGPYNNSDSLSGHGTHVAGIVAADGTGNDELIGVAPDADIIGYSTGDVAFIVTIVAAYENIIEHRDDWNIDVANNSWGSGFRLFDPDDPVNVATKAAHDAGVVVTFSAGNDTDDGTINPYSVAPWVISVGATTISKQKSDFSSGGLQFDNSQSTTFDDPANKHVHFDGDGLGLYHPDVSAPGSDIVSAGTPTGAYVGPTEPGGEASASGTSMSSPHAAGLAALLLQARSSLTPDQVRDVLQVTAMPMADGTPFWRSGYGFTDAKAAVDYVSAPTFSAEQLAAAQASADARVRGNRDWEVLSSDQWSFTALPATIGGLDSRSFELPVSSTTKAISASVAFPTTPLIGINLFEYSITLFDAAGTEVATSEVSSNAGVSSLFVDLRALEAAPEYGTWTVEVDGLVGASDPNILLGNVISLSVAQLTPQPNQGGSGPGFTPGGSEVLYFTPAGDAGPLPGPEGCEQEGGPPAGALESAPGSGTCREGVVGYSANYAADIPASWETTAPSGSDLTIGGPATLVFYLADAAQPAWSAAFASGVGYSIEMVAPDGTVTEVAAGDTPERAAVGPAPTRGEYTFDVPPTTVPSGSLLRVTLRFSGFYTSTMRLLYGGGAYADAGVTLTTGTIG
jgi:serine protease AprX